jgi:uncharacterized protein YecT (DUF1311 family)
LLLKHLKFLLKLMRIPNEMKVTRLWCLRATALVTVLLLANCSNAQATNQCGGAVTPIDRAICSDAGLAKRDAELNAAYAKVRLMATPAAQVALLSLQRAWIAGRNRRCPSAKLDCLAAQYDVRVEQLHALAATAAANDDQLSDATPIVLTGEWRIVEVNDSDGKIADTRSLRNALNGADLPPLGTIIRTGNAQLRSSDQPCETIGWQATKIGRLEGGARLASQLKRPTTARAYHGSTGSIRSSFTLVPGKQGDLWAVFSLCDSNENNCRFAWQVWRRATPDAAITPD